MPEYFPFEYQNVMVDRVVDGDTVALTVDVGFGFRYQDNFRLIGIDTPERGQPGFREATEFTELWLMKHAATGLELHSVKRDKYGRGLATIRSLRTGDILNDDLISSGHAVPYDGGRRE